MLAILSRWTFAFAGCAVCAVAIGFNASINYVVAYQYGSTADDALAFGAMAVAAVALKISAAFMMVSDRRDRGWGKTIIAAILWFACAVFSISATLAVMKGNVQPHGINIHELRLLSDGRPRHPELAPSTHGARPTNQHIGVIAGWAEVSDDRIALLLSVLAAVCFELAASLGPHVVWSLTLRHSQARGAGASDDRDHIASTESTTKSTELDRVSSGTKRSLTMGRSGSLPSTDLVVQLRTFMKVQIVHSSSGAIGATDLFNRFQASSDLDITQRRFGDLMAKLGYCDKGREPGTGRVVYQGLSWHDTDRQSLV